MREIKFRAWDVERLNMFLPTFIDEHGMLYVLLADGTIKLRSMDAVLMQYTGLKDKNGVEIYEGDIVEEDSLGRPQTVFYSTEHAGFKLGFNGNNTQYDKRESLWADYCKVIGNIYENKELLV